jgi:OOP family OmpA-OmpF porin
MVPLPNVQYYTGSSLMLSESAKDLEPLARYLVKHENLHATIYGHTDNVGKRQDNLKLSQDRAESVKQFLINQGVEASRLTAIGKGDTEPIRDNSKQEGRMLNRRVEVKLVEQETSETHRVIKDESNHNKQ